MKIGRGSRIMLKTRVYKPEMISIGDRTYINEYCYLDGRGGLKIGSDVTIAVYSKIVSAGHNIDSNEFEYTDRVITIGDHVAIFANALVLGGANIQDGCVFFAGSVVPGGIYNKRGVYAGVPCKYIRERKSDLSYRQDNWHPIFR